MIWSNGQISQVVSVPGAGAYSIAVTADGSSAGGVWPLMRVSIDGVAVKTFAINSASPAAYSTTARRKAGAHVISIAFTNDAMIGRQDRNLWVEKLALTGP